MKYYRNLKILEKLDVKVPCFSSESWIYSSLLQYRSSQVMSVFRNPFPGKLLICFYSIWQNYFSEYELIILFPRITVLNKYLLTDIHLQEMSSFQAAVTGFVPFSKHIIHIQ